MTFFLSPKKFDELVKVLGAMAVYLNKEALVLKLTQGEALCFIKDISLGDQ